MTSLKGGGLLPHTVKHPECTRPWALVAVLLLLSLAARPGLAENRQGAGARPAYPSLAELVPKARELTEEKALLDARLGQLSALQGAESALAELQKKHETAVAALKAVEAAGDYTLDRLLRMREGLRPDAAAVDSLVADLTGRMEEIDANRKRWVELQALWKDWEAQVPRKDAGPAVRTTFAEARAALEYASNRLSRTLPLIVPVQRQAVELQAEYREVQKKVEDLTIAVKGGIFGRWAWPMYTSEFWAQVAFSVRSALSGSAARTIQIGVQLSPNWPLLLLVHAVVFGAFALILRWSRREGPVGQRWNGLLERPYSAAILAGALLPVVLYTQTQRLPLPLSFTVSLLSGIAAVRLAPRLIVSRAARRTLYVVVGAFLLDRFLRVVGVPTPLLRVWNAFTGFVGAPLFFYGAYKWRKRGEPTSFVLASRVGGVLFAVVCIGQVAGYSSLGFRIAEGLIWSTFLLPLWRIFSLLLRGSTVLLLEGAVHTRWPSLEHRRGEILRTVGIATDGAALCVFASISLVVWRVFDTPLQAIEFLLNLGFSVGQERITVGLTLSALAVLYLALTASRVLEAVLEGQVFPQRGVDPGAGISINRLIRYAFVLVGFLLALGVLGIELGKLAVLAGALGVGIGFGLQAIVNNFVSGLILLSERPVKVGDLLQLGNEWGKVTELGLRATTIQTFDRSEIIVPNAELVSSRVVNWTHSDRSARLILPVGVAFGTEVAKVMRLLEEVALAHPKVARDPAPQAFFLRFGESSLDFQLMARVWDIDDRLGVQSDLLQALERRFREEGIQIPFPQRVVHAAGAGVGSAD